MKHFVFLLLLPFIIFINSNLQAQWMQTNSPYGGKIFAFAISPNGTGGNNIFAGTEYGGVWRRPLSELITAVDRSNDYLPTAFLLEQNYPNPFNPTTIIGYEIPKDGMVTITLYDDLGREVRTLVNKNQEAGRYEITFNASELASGVYFYRINVNGENGRQFTSIKKMILMK